MSKSLSARIRQLSSLWIDDPHEDVRNEVAAMLERVTKSEAEASDLKAQVAKIVEQYRNLYIASLCCGQDFNYLSYEARVKIANRELDVWESNLPAAARTKARD